MIETQLEGKNLSKTYHIGDDTIVALKGVNLKAVAGEMIAICGPSGSGKSTLLHLLGLIDRPNDGEIYYDRNLIAYDSDIKLAAIRSKKIGFMFQSYNLIDVLNARDNVSLPLTNLGLPMKERKEMAEGALEDVGLLKMENRYPNQLSGGQKQRVGIARALVHKPEIVLCDEITANLDTSTAEDLMKLLRSMNEKYGTTFIFSTHDSLILKYVNRVIWMRDGEISKETDSADAISIMGRDR